MPGMTIAQLLLAGSLFGPSKTVPPGAFSQGLLRFSSGLVYLVFATFAIVHFPLSTLTDASFLEVRWACDIASCITCRFV